MPPPIEICILDGLGGGDCVEADGTRLYRPPSKMKNYWATSQEDQAKFAAWCYDASPEEVAQQMNQIRKGMK